MDCATLHQRVILPCGEISRPFSGAWIYCALIFHAVCDDACAKTLARQARYRVGWRDVQPTVQSN